MSPSLSWAQRGWSMICFTTGPIVDSPAGMKDVCWSNTYREFLPKNHLGRICCDTKSSSWTDSNNPRFQSTTQRYMYMYITDYVVVRSSTGRSRRHSRWKLVIHTHWNALYGYPTYSLHVCIQVVELPNLQSIIYVQRKVRS